MIRTLIIFFVIIFLVWFTRDYFSITLPSDEPVKKEPKEKKHTKFFSKNTFKTDSISSTSKKTIRKENFILAQLLEEDKFYDALSFYLENTTQDNQKMIENYLHTLVKIDAALALKYMQVFWENVPESQIWKQMLLIYFVQDNLSKAIELIMQAKENYVSESEDRRLASQLRDASVAYIEKLQNREEYTKLISFLEEMIAYDSTDNFYAFRLAQLYMKLDKTEEASLLLEGLKYDEVYAQNVKTLLNSMDKQEEEQYEYAIALQHYGEHYVVQVFLDGNPFNLVLDTGATFIFIDEDKASMLEVLRDDLILETAGNNVHAKLCNASSMKIGNLTLSNIQVTIAPFKRDGIDGLLGMNFFKQFTFFINQEEDILYLNPK